MEATTRSALYGSRRRQPTGEKKFLQSLRVYTVRTPAWERKGNGYFGVPSAPPLSTEHRGKKLFNVACQGKEGRKKKELSQSYIPSATTDGEGGNLHARSHFTAAKGVLTSKFSSPPSPPPEAGSSAFFNAPRADGPRAVKRVSFEHLEKKSPSFLNPFFLKVLSRSQSGK